MILTNSDFDQISTLITNALKENNRQLLKGMFDYIAKTCATKQDIARLEEKISHLPKKEEFYKKMDKWMVAASTKELEGAVHKKRHDRAEKRLDKIESHLGIVSI